MTRPSRPYEPSAILRWLYERFFRHISVDERWTDAVRSAANQGVVVYVMRSISFLDFLCLDFLVKQWALPVIRFANDLGLWILEPFGKGERRLRLRRQVPEEDALRETVKNHFSALLFLRRPPSLGRFTRKGEELHVDLIRSLVEAQRTMEKAILLVPQTFVWSKLPSSRKRRIWDFLLGPSDWPGRMRVFFQFLFNYRDALLRSGEPFDLQAFVSAHVALSDEEIADRVRYALLRRMERERTIVLGPTKKSPARIREELLRSPRVRTHIEAEARSTKKSIEKVEQQARKELKAMCAAQGPYALWILHRILHWVWTRIYDGLIVDKEGLERVREAARHGAVVFLPSHKSHVDYLVLSDVLYENALSPPLIAAGDNLGFWPLGPLLRKGGGFFIRRVFRGKRLYSVLVDAYLRKLLVEGFAVEFFIEGGRSRTGKLLPPKFGLLSMIVEAALLLPQKKIHFVPVSIGYERIVEEGSYVHELSGGAKSKEGISGLLRTPKILQSRYGRLYVQFGDILPFNEMAHGLDREHLTPAEKRSLVQKIGHQVVYEINRVTVVTPTSLVATALLIHRRRGIPHAELVSVLERLLAILSRLGAPIAHSVRSENGELRSDTLKASIDLFADGKLLLEHRADHETIYTVPEERRMALEYYMNNILHFFVANALISSVILQTGSELISLSSIRDRVHMLSRLFKYEFMYRVDLSFDQILDEALASMARADEVERISDHVRVAEGCESRAQLQMYAAMIRSYFESYRLALGGVKLLLRGPMGRKEWVRKTLALGQRMYLAGELEARESLARTKLENALNALRDLGIVRFAEQESLAISDQVRGEEDLTALQGKFAAFLY